MDQVDTIVIGAGVVGLAVARAQALLGRDVLLVEAAHAIGTGTSSRNSEVVHAGIYYPQGSLKAQLCVRGKELLYAYCEQRGVPHRRCGKLIAATTEAEQASLDLIRERAARNGVNDLMLLTREEALAMEPSLRCVAALHSPSTGIVDSHALMLALWGDFENAGGVLALHSEVQAVRCDGVSHAKGMQVRMVDGTEILARQVINAAGLQAPALAKRFSGLDPVSVPGQWFAKGNYFTMSSKAPFSRLIYPVPVPGGLGIHLTLDMGGQARFGPDVQWVDRADDLEVDATRGHAFYAEVRKYWPDLPDGALQVGYAGMRPKISGPSEPSADFVIQGPQDHGIAGLVNLFGIESPGLTSCLAIGQYVTELLP